MEAKKSLQYEVEKSPDDQLGNKVTTVRCHGRLTSEHCSELKGVIKPLIVAGGHIVVDLGDLQFMDSSGLAAMISLKVSAINRGLCILEFVNMTPRVMDLLRMTALDKVL